jgi:hypothetical protein
MHLLVSSKELIQLKLDDLEKVEKTKMRSCNLLKLQGEI